MSKALRFISENICFIMIVLGCGVGIYAFFTDWETFDGVPTDGWALAFGELHDLWYPAIGTDCYIPLSILICSILSGCAFVCLLYRRELTWKMMLLCTVCGAFMLLSMSVLALTAFDYHGELVYFANYIGQGTRHAWLASVLILVGGGLYIASHRRGEDGK